MNLLEKASPKTHASMFSGIGGFDLALGRVGFRTVWANDIDKYACQVYRKNLDGSVLVEGDIREVDAKSIPDHDLLSAGFPCQAFSLAGKRKGISESRGTLFYHIYRVAKVKRPKLLLLENVKGLLSNESGRTFATIIRLLEGLGYLIEWQVLNSKYFGVPQNRERVFIIGHSRDSPSKQIFPIGEACQLPFEENRSEQEVEKRVRSGSVCSTLDARYGSLRCQGETYVAPTVMENNRCEVRSVVAQTLEASYGKTKSLTNTVANCLSHSDGKDGSENLIQIAESYEKHGSQAGRVYSSEGIAPTIHKSGGNTEPLILLSHTKANIKQRQQNREETWTLDGTSQKQAIISQALQTDGFLRQGSSFGTDLPQSARNIRRLTPLECERLQGFPDNYTQGVSDTQRYKLLGNAVTVNVIEFLGTLLMNQRRLDEATTEKTTQ